MVLSMDDLFVMQSKWLSRAQRQTPHRENFSNEQTITLAE